MRRWWLLLALAGCDDGGSDPRQPAMDAAVLDMTVDMQVDATLLDQGGDQALDMAVDQAIEVDAGPVELTAQAGADQFGIVGQTVQLDGSASTGAVAFEWDFGNGTRWEEPRETAEAEVTYDAPGRYRATLTAIGADGSRRTDVAILTITRSIVHAPVHSTTIVADGMGVAALVPDAGKVVRVQPSDDGFGIVETLDTCADAARIARWDDRFVVTCNWTDTVQIVGGPSTTLRYGARPYGMIAIDDRLYVALQGTGEVVALDQTLTVLERWTIGPDIRGIAALPDGRLLITRWRSVDGEGRVFALNPADGTVEPWTLAVDPQGASDTEIGGVPSYLDQPLVAPDGAEVAFPALQANLAHGLLFDEEEPAFDTVLRAVVAFSDAATGEERFEARKQFDGRGFASAGVYASRGDFLFLAMRGSQVIERIDRLTDNQSGTLLQSGIGVDGLVLSADDRWLFANAGLSRELRIWDVSDLRAVPLPAQVISLVDEPLDPVIALGKRLFNDSADERLSREGYIACAHCHLDGDSDRLNWDFTARGEGLRNTISMLGRMGAGHGPIHWSGNFDEIQDFEHDMRGPFGGMGLLDDADFEASADTLGARKAGLNADLDALAAYATSLDAVYRSPFKAPDGSATEAMLRGQVIFTRLACDGCHVPPMYTDSAFTEPGVPRLHDVGTLRPDSGQRLGAELTGIDTPTLLGVFDGGPFLHDGSAPTLRAVLVERNPDGLHGETGELTPEELADLEAFLLGLDGRDGF
jgi:PKD repeat protein